MTRKHEKIRRRQIAWEFPVYHDPLIAASRYVMRKTEGMFQSIYMDIKEYWGDISGTAAVRIYVMHNGKMYRSYCLRIDEKEFDNMREQDISPERYCKAILASEVFDLYAKIISEEGRQKM